MVRAPWVCHPPASPGLEYPSPPPPASSAWTPPQPVDQAAPPRLLAPLPPPSPVDPPAPPGSLIPPAPPWLGVDPPLPLESSPLAAPRRSVPPALLGSVPPVCSTWVLSCSTAEPSAPPWTPRSSTPPWLVGSPPRAPSPPAPPPLVCPLESVAIPPPWLLPLSAPPWAIIMAVAWVLLCTSSCLFPGSVTPVDSVFWRPSRGFNLLVARGAWFSEVCSGRETQETAVSKWVKCKMRNTCVWLQ